MRKVLWEEAIWTAVYYHNTALMMHSLQASLETADSWPLAMCMDSGKAEESAECFHIGWWGIESCPWENIAAPPQIALEVRRPDWK